MHPLLFMIIWEINLTFIQHSIIMKKDIESKLIDKNTRPTSMRILVYDFLSV